MSATNPSLPSGRVTFVFTDVVGSTRTFIEHGQVFVEALTVLQEMTADHARRRNGVVVATEGDGAFLAFPDASSAVDALITLQEELEQSTRPGVRLRIRAGAHTGDAVPVGGDYLAVPVHVAARVCAAANAGQLLVTDAVVRDLTASGWPHIRTAVDVGSYSLKDFPDPVRLWRLAGEPAPPRATPARRTNVRQSRTSFVGRDRDIDQLRELVELPGLVTVVGPGGVGKTRLVSEFALQDAETFAGGAWLVELATLDAADQVIGTVGASLGLTTGETSDVVNELNRRGRCLLVLDNCEHLLDAVVEVVDPLLERCPELTILCTSREALHLVEERVWTVPPLLSVKAGLQLFLDRSQAADGRELELDLMTEICAALDGLPLAIELAASQARSSPMSDLLGSVLSGKDPLARRGGQERQRSLDTVLHWSLDKLSTQLRDSLLVLSVFPGRFSPDMARTVLGRIPRCDASAGSQLVARSLVDLDGDDYRLLFTIRDAARRLLAQDSGLDQLARNALVQWTATYATERWEMGGFHEDVPPDTLLAVELGLAWALDAGASGLGKAWNLVDSVAGSRGASAALIAVAERAMSLPPRDPDTVLVLAAAGQISRVHTGRALSMAKADVMIAVARGSGDPRVLERALHAGAMSAEAEGRLDAAWAHRMELLELVESTPELARNRPAALTNLANNYFFRGDRATSTEYLLRAAAASQRPEFRVSHATAHLNLSENALLDGRSEDARAHAVTALKTAPPDWLFRSFAMAYLARAYSRLGDRAAALAAGREALPDLRRRARHNQQQAAEDLAGLLEEVPELDDE